MIRFQGAAVGNAGAAQKKPGIITTRRRSYDYSGRTCSNSIYCQKYRQVPRDPDHLIIGVAWQFIVVDDDRFTKIRNDVPR
jgi:hypothetical protein